MKLSQTFQSTDRPAAGAPFAGCIVAALVAMCLFTGCARAANSVTCDTTVANRADLVAATNGDTNEGKVICARAGDYGEVALEGRHDSKVTLRAYPGEVPVMGGLDLNGVSNFRVEGFDFPRGGVDSRSSSVQGIEIVGNRFFDYVGAALHIWGGDSDITFAKNLVRNMGFNGQWWSGWGISGVGGTKGIRNLRVRYNTFDHTENDAMELGALDGFEIVGNVVEHVNDNPAYEDPHADSLMIWANSRNGLVKDNRFTDGNGLLFTDTVNVRVENNLVANIDNWCWENGPSVRQTFVNNTVYACGSDYGGAGYGVNMDGASGAVFQRNLLASVNLSAGGAATADHNLLKHGSGPGSIRFRGAFADQADRQATNLPSGYKDVGYRPAPAGADARQPRGGGLFAKCSRVSKPRRRRGCFKRALALARCQRIEGSTKRAQRKRAVCRRRASRIPTIGFESD